MITSPAIYVYIPKNIGFDVYSNILFIGTYLLASVYITSDPIAR